MERKSSTPTQCISFKKNSEYKLLNKDHINELRRKLYAYKKEAKTFRNILMT